mmetsp:Transcript_13866/g.35765  ORF Transcript_13866/g.35765 Transcript_13866/m.35765 type:complete len:207 (+) Transcript_13866:291-911(+)
MPTSQTCEWPMMDHDLPTSPLERRACSYVSPQRGEVLLPFALPLHHGCATASQPALAAPPSPAGSAGSVSFEVVKHVIHKPQTDLERALGVRLHDPVRKHEAHQRPHERVEGAQDGRARLAVGQVVRDRLLVLSDKLIRRIPPRGLDGIRGKVRLARGRSGVLECGDHAVGGLLIVDPLVRHAPYPQLVEDAAVRQHRRRAARERL